MALALPAAVLHVGPTPFAQGHAGGAKCPPKPCFNAPEDWTGLVGREKSVRQPPEGLSEAAEATRWHPKGPLRPASRWLGRVTWHCQENSSSKAQIPAHAPQRVPPSGITLALAAPPLASWTLSSESRHIYASFPLEIIQAGGCSATLSCFPHQEDRERSPRQLPDEPATPATPANARDDAEDRARMPPPEPRAAAPVIAPQFLPENQPGAARAAAPQFNADGRPVQLCDARGSALAPRAILQPQAASATGAEDAFAPAELAADASMSDAAHADENADYVPFQPGDAELPSGAAGVGVAASAAGAAAAGYPHMMPAQAPTARAERKQHVGSEGTAAGADAGGGGEAEEAVAMQEDDELPAAENVDAEDVSADAGYLQIAYGKDVVRDDAGPMDKLTTLSHLNLFANAEQLDVHIQPTQGMGGRKYGPIQIYMDNYEQAQYIEQTMPTVTFEQQSVRNASDKIEITLNIKAFRVADELKNSLTQRGIDDHRFINMTNSAGYYRP